MSAIVDRKLWTALRRVVDARMATHALISVLLAAVASGAMAVAPIFLAQIVDGVGLGGALPVASAALYLGSLCASRVAGHVQAYYSTLLDQRLQRRIGQTTLNHLLGLPLGFHLGVRAGSLLQVYQNAVQGARILVSLACASLLPVFVQVAVILSVVASLFDITIWLLMSLTMTAYAAVFTWNVDRVTKATAPAITLQVAATGLFSDSIANIEAVKNNTAEERLGAIYADASECVERAWRFSHWRRLEAGLAVSLVFSFSMGTGIILGLERVQSGHLSAGGLVLLTAYMLQMIGPLETTGYAFRDLAQAASFLSDWKRVLARTQEDAGAAPHAGPRVEGLAPSVRFERVSFAYGDRQVLCDVTLEARPGEILAIVGATGSGKTSLLRLLQKHIAPDAGSVMIDGVSIAELSTRALRRRISVVSQDVVLFNETLRYNLIFANPEASESEIASAVRQSRLEALVSALPEGLNTIVGERGLKLSGGERQRVALARAILRGGDILLLDEATSALDVRTEEEILAEMLQIADGRTTIVVTHRLALAATAATIAVLRDGHVAEMGGHEELLARGGAYAALWEAQARPQGLKHGLIAAVRSGIR